MPHEYRDRLNLTYCIDLRENKQEKVDKSELKKVRGNVDNKTFSIGKLILVLWIISNGPGVNSGMPRTDPCRTNIIK